jgi:uncharacterized protein YecE (DUF72 family)
MLQFEYLNKSKMPSMGEFIDRLGRFIEDAPSGYSYALEPRNPQLFKPPAGKPYFEFLRSHGLSQVFLQGYYMPEITTIYHPWRDYIEGETVIRLHGYERSNIEKKTKKQYNRIVEPLDEELPGIISMIQDMRSRGVMVYLNVNNHYEGSAPLSIQKIESMLSRADESI